MMQNNIVFLGCTGDFGRSFSACNTKIEFVIRGLKLEGDRCVVHNGINGSSLYKHILNSDHPFAETIIDYPARVNWYVAPFINFKQLIVDLRRLYVPGCKNVVVLEAPYIIYYWLMLLASKFCGYKVVVISHEWLATFRNANILRQISNICYSKFFCYGVDAVLPISEYIIDKIEHFKKPMFKLPVLADFSHGVPNVEKGDYFMYCVSAEFFRVIAILLEAFELYRRKGGGYRFVLVLAGSESAKAKVREEIAVRNMNDDVDVLCSIQYDVLFSMYTKAAALLLPLDPSREQDRARFSQKTAEYLSSASAIITNPVGENAYYFQDGEDVIMADFTQQGFCDAFKWVEENPHAARKIGRKGFYRGADVFDYKVCGKHLHDFLLRI